MHRTQVRGLTPWSVQHCIWSTCFRQQAGGNAANQQPLDGPSTLSDAQAAAILDAYQRSDTLLQNLRSWMSTLHVSSLVLDSTRSQTDQLAAQVEKARGL